MKEITDEQVYQAIRNAVGRTDTRYVGMKALYDELRVVLNKNIPLWFFHGKIWKMYTEKKLTLSPSSAISAEVRKYAIERKYLYYYVYTWNITKKGE